MPNMAMTTTTATADFDELSISAPNFDELSLSDPEVLTDTEDGLEVGPAVGLSVGLAVGAVKGGAPQFFFF